MENKRKTIIFTLAGVLAITIICIAGYYIWNKQAKEAIRLEGQKYADEYLARYVIRCGENTFISAESQLIDSRGSLMPVKQLMQTEWVKAIYVPSKDSLTASELKEEISAKGKILVINGKFREYNFIRQKWDRWIDEDHRIDGVIGTSLYRTNEGWSVMSISNLGQDFISTKNYGAKSKLIACEDIPK